MSPTPGRYSFIGDRVIHQLELSLFPNWVGSDQERWVELAGDRLMLSASPLLTGKQQRSTTHGQRRRDPGLVAGPAALML